MINEYDREHFPLLNEDFIGVVRMRKNRKDGHNVYGNDTIILEVLLYLKVMEKVIIGN